VSIIENLSDPLLSALGWTLLNAVWQLLIIALLWRLSLYLARKGSANLRYNISLLAMLAMPVVFTFTFFRQFKVYLQAARIVSLEFEESLFQVSPLADSNFYLIGKSYPAIFSHFESIAPKLVWFYLAGILLFSFNSMISYSRLYNLKYRNTIALPAHWQNKVREFRKKIGLNQPIRVYQSSKISVPALVGLFKPVILLPVAMLSSLTPAQVEAILLHEMYHLRRFDHYINVLQNFLEILFFFHPATWLISRRLREEREKCVDEWVVTQTSSPLAYAQALMTLEENRSAALQPVVAATQSKSLLLTRIKNIMTMKTRSFNPGQKLAALLVIITAAFSVAWMNPATTLNYGHPGPDYSLDAPVYFDLTTLSKPEQEIDTPLPVQEEFAQQHAQATPQPRQIYLQNGKTVRWEELSEEDRQKLQAAMTEMRIALQEVNREMREKFNSEEFRQQMAQTQQEIARSREEVRRAMEEARRESNEYFNSEEFRQEMQKAREDVRKAMEDVKQKTDYINSEEFRLEMQKAREEVRKAMEEVRKQMQEQGFNPDDMDQIEWEKFNRELQKSMEELNKTLEKIGPAIQQSLKEINIDEIMRDVLDSIEKAFPDTTRKE